MVKANALGLCLRWCVRR